jgi:hypothetical protein
LQIIEHLFNEALKRMPPKKSKTTKKKSSRLSEEDDIHIDQIDVQYNPDIVTSLLDELAQAVEVKCAQIQKDSDFLATSIQQAFHLELIKLPTQVKQMSIKRFKEEFGFSLEAVTRGAIGGHALNQHKGSHRGDHSFGGNSRANASNRVMQTPSSSKYSSAQTPRLPREGERMVSENGSPLGEFTTVKKAPKTGGALCDMAVPPTPGVFVPLKNGDILDVDATDVENLPQDVKAETLEKVQEMMMQMQSLMAKLQPGRV